MKIEKITLDDSPFIQDMYQSCFGKSVNKGHIESLLSKSAVQGFKINNKAFLLIQKMNDETEIIDIAVAPHARGKGLAKKLLNYLKTLSPTIFLEVNENNIPALSLYKNIGFEQISIRKNYYNNKEDAIVMVFKT